MMKRDVIYDKDHENPIHIDCHTELHYLCQKIIMIEGKEWMISMWRCEKCQKTVRNRMYEIREMRT
jgi:hypothetical protein